jgi:hypothetical protein
VAPDVPKNDLKLDLQPTKLSFKGPSISKKVTYAVDLDFYDEIDPKESKINHLDRDIILVLRKKELKEEYWPRLLKDNKKAHFLKTDFDKVYPHHTKSALTFIRPCSLTCHSGLTKTSKMKYLRMRTTCLR